MVYRKHDREIWEAIFEHAPPDWLSAPPSDLMRHCLSYFRSRAGRRILDLGSGFGRWSVFLGENLGTAVTGIDYAYQGNSLGRRLASQHRCKASFVTGEVTALPFRDGAFDKFLAALILDNLAEAHGRRAVSEIRRVMKRNAQGFVVLNPWPVAERCDPSNPTAGCTRRDYTDDEVGGLLKPWHILAKRSHDHGFRAFEVELPGGGAV